jgi:hypothetical protein
MPRRRGARGGPRRAAFIGNPLPVLAFNRRVCAVPRAPGIPSIDRQSHHETQLKTAFHADEVADIGRGRCHRARRHRRDPRGDPKSAHGGSVRGPRALRRRARPQAGCRQGRQAESGRRHQAQESTELPDARPWCRCQEKGSPRLIRSVMRLRRRLSTSAFCRGRCASRPADRRASSAGSSRRSPRSSRSRRRRCWRNAG